MRPPTNKGDPNKEVMTEDRFHAEIVADITTRNLEHNYIRQDKMLDITIANKHKQHNTT